LPLPWISVATEVKVYGFVCTTSLTMHNGAPLLGQSHIAGFEATLRCGGGRHISTLAARRMALETYMYAISKVWYLAQPLSHPRRPCLANQEGRECFSVAGQS
jgi:hypothetical protein